MNMPEGPESKAIIDTLIAHAARDGLGEEVSWVDVELAISQLLDAAVSASNLRRRMEKVNDAEVALTLADWFDRAADARETDARNAARPSEKILAPLQGVGFGGAATAAILTASGALGLAAGAIIGASALAAGLGATVGRLRLSGRQDDALADSKAIRRMADIARSRGNRQ